MATQIYNWLHDEGCINYIADHGASLGEIP